MKNPAKVLGAFLAISSLIFCCAIPIGKKGKKKMGIIIIIGGFEHE